MTGRHNPGCASDGNALAITVLVLSLLACLLVLLAAWLT